jgi:AcrR family transcriptional regulator
MSGATTRAQIVEAADRLFYQRGYEHTSFATVADAVHLSGNFYYHFRSKDDILGAVIDTRLSGTRQMLEQREAQDADPAGRIRTFIHILLTNRSNNAISRWPCRRTGCSAAGSTR